jgi:hypothetical protein
MLFPESICPFYIQYAYCLVSLPDMWAMGAIIAELFSLRPLFPGTRYTWSSMKLYLICMFLVDVCGVN